MNLLQLIHNLTIWHKEPYPPSPLEPDHSTYILDFTKLCIPGIGILTPSRVNS